MSLLNYLVLEIMMVLFLTTTLGKNVVQARQLSFLPSEVVRKRMFIISCLQDQLRNLFILWLSDFSTSFVCLVFPNIHMYMYMQVISTKALLTHPQGLSGLLAEVLEFIPQHCSLLLEVTISGVSGVTGYDFLVNAVWPVVANVIDRKASVIFAPGNPDTFHKVSYKIIMEALFHLFSSV